VTTAGKKITFNTSSSADILVPNTYVSSISFNDATTSQRSAALAVTLTVTPKQDTITVRASPNADGMVSDGGTFTGGTSHAVTATPNTGHSFVHWTENGRVASTAESYTFTLTGNVTLVADFR
jgi:nitrogen fixation protein FixH